jgi:formate-dependent nitrite reductase membrane component NrfD
MLVSAIFDKNVVHHVLSLKKIHLTLLITEVFLIFTMFLITSSTNESAAKSVSMLVTGEYRTLFWLGLVAAGLIIPILFEALELFNSKKLN